MLQYQSENFGKSSAYRSRQHVNYVKPPHIHEFYELAFTYQGSTTVYIDEIKYTVPEQHAILILPNQIHEYTAETNSHMRCAVFSSDLIYLAAMELDQKTLANPIIDFSSHWHLLNDLGETDTSNVLRHCGLLNLIFEHILNVSQLIPRPSADHILLHDVIRYVSQHYKDDITLKELALKLGYHEKYLSTALHTITKMNFRTFLAQYRIAEAQQRIAIENKSISSVAADCGFNSINTFNRLFKQITHMTPKAYQSSMRSDTNITE